jgi:[protein-PII] uridylyltransferase
VAPFSDVDLTFVYMGDVHEELRVFVERVLRLLWDGGLVVGHSVRSVSESVRAACQDTHVATALQEARLLWGSRAVFDRLRRELEAVLYKGRRQRERFLDALRHEWEKRYAQVGAIIGVQEPHVKEGAGGLRDLQMVRWVGRARYGSSGLEALCAENHLSGAEYAVLRSSYDFLLRVRNEAHFSTGRKWDQLTVDMHSTLARHLGYTSRRGLQASEVFMREYYHHAHSVHEVCRSFLARAWASPQGARAWWVGRWWRERVFQRFEKSRRNSGSEPFEIADGMLRLRGRLGDPLQLMRAFQIAQSARVVMSEELRQTIRQQGPAMGRALRRSPEAGRIFLEIVSQRGEVARILRLMHETGVLGRFLPEFGRLTFLVQHDFYHAYTVDEHTLHAIEALDRVWRNPSGALMATFHKVFREIGDVVPLYLGLLFHDVGKGRGHGHVGRGVRLAHRACQRLGVDEGRRQMILFLVRHHLLLSHVAERRDVTEEKVIEEVVNVLGESAPLERLNMLLLLTYADTAGVGPNVWTEWKGVVLWELYWRAREWITRRRVAGEGDDGPALEDLVRDLAREFPAPEVERHLAQLPERYRRATTRDRIAEHLRLIRRVSEESVVVHWRTIREGGYTEVSVCTFDRPGLFAQLAGTLTAHGLNILSADAYTREDGIIIDTFRVCEIGALRPVPPERWPGIERSMKAAVEGRYDVAQAVARRRARFARKRMQSRREPIIRCDNAASLTCTILEVEADDEPGLAYTIASTLQALGLNIVLAKVATEKSRALDVFYITDAEGRKLTSALIAAVERALGNALASGAPTIAPPARAV